MTRFEPVVGRPWWPLAGIVALGAALRLHRLTFQSLWLDELFSVIFSRPGATVAEIVEVYATDVHPLIYPLLLHFWMMALGDSEFSARLLSVLLAVVGIIAMFLVGKVLGGTRLGLTAALVTACNPFHIAYSQEARSYTLVFLVAALSYGALVMLLHRPSWRWALSWGLLTAFAVHVHYYALVMLVGQVAAAGLALVWRRAPRQEWRYGASAVALVGLTILPWVEPLRRVSSMQEYWPTPPRPWFVLEYFHHYFGNNLVLSLVAGGLVLALPLLLRGRGSDDGDPLRPPPALVVKVLGGAVGVSLAVAYARSVLVVPMLMPRFTFVFVPAVILLLAIALDLLEPGRVRGIAVAGMVVLSLAGLLATGYYTDVSKEQWREAVATMASDPRFDPVEDRCLAAITPGFQYYVDRQVPGFRLHELTADELRSVAERQPPPALWLLLARDERPGEEFRRIQQRHFRRTDTWQLFKTSVERWQPVTAPEPR